MTTHPQKEAALAAMQRAVDVVLTSPHPTSKVAACLLSADGQHFITATNYWPGAIISKISPDVRIGSSSSTIHAEIEAILNAPFATEGASIFVTDPVCPNCAKNIAEAGIKNIFIDHKGFEKDFAKRRGDEFESLSLRVAIKAGINIYEVRRKEGVITPIEMVADDYVPLQDNPIKLIELPAMPEAAGFKAILADVKIKHPRWACALAHDKAGKAYSLIASAHPAIGYSEELGAPQVDVKEGKYNFWLEPLNRLLMGAARFGLKLLPDYIFASQVPTDREQINFIAGGYTQLLLGNAEAARDENGLLAKQLLEDNKIISFFEYR